MSDPIDSSAAPTVATAPTVAVFDVFAGKDPCVQELCAALNALGANAAVTSDPAEAVSADGTVLAASGDSAAALQALHASQAARVVGQRLAGSRPVLAVGAAMDALFERGPQGQGGFGEWSGGVDKLAAPLTRAAVAAAEGSEMFAGDAEFVFDAGTGVGAFEMAEDEFLAYPTLSWVEGMPVLAGVENGPLWAVRFHPERSGAAGSAVLRNWISRLG